MSSLQPPTPAHITIFLHYGAHAVAPPRFFFSLKKNYLQKSSQFPHPSPSHFFFFPIENCKNLPLPPSPPFPELGYPTTSIIVPPPPPKKENRSYERAQPRPYLNHMDPPQIGGGHMKQL